MPVTRCELCSECHHLITICCVIFYYVFRPLRFSDERQGDHNGCRVGVCHTANYHRQTAIRPGSKNHWPEGGMVFWFAVHRQQR